MVKRPAHRPTKYDPKNTPRKVREYCLKGLINEEIAKKLGISACIFYEWQNKYPELVEAVKEGKKVVDDEVEQALYNTAKGGKKYTETTRELVREGDRKGKLVITKKVKKVMLPNARAQEFWLKNRRPKDFRDRHEITGPEGGPIGIVFIPDKQTPEEWIKDANSDKRDGVEPAAETDAGTEVSGG